ncbi:MAG: hypothetical protein LLF78_06850 [Synergistaceae bacterium]|nr:hypothetical protein [Synergistaceae bacterium]
MFEHDVYDELTVLRILTDAMTGQWFDCSATEIKCHRLKALFAGRIVILAPLSRIPKKDGGVK